MEDKSRNPYDPPTARNASDRPERIDAGSLHPVARMIFLAVLVLVGAWLGLWLTVAFLHWWDTL